MIEVSLAIVVSLVVMSAGIVGYRQVRLSSQFSQARMMVGTIQTNISVEKYRSGNAPPLAGANSITSNLDSASKPYWPQTAGALPADPITGRNAVSTFTYSATFTPLAAGDPSPQWDNAIYATAPTPSPGGWLYDASTGAFRLNLTNKAYPEQRPGTW